MLSSRTLLRLPKRSVGTKLPTRVNLVRSSFGFSVHMPRSHRRHAGGRLSSGSHLLHTLSVMHYRRLPRIHFLISVTVQTTPVTCQPAPRTSAKCSSNGTGPLDRNCQLPPTFLPTFDLTFCLAITYGFVITADALNVSTPSRNSD